MKKKVVVLILFVISIFTVSLFVNTGHKLGHNYMNNEYPNWNKLNRFSSLTFDFKDLSSSDVNSMFKVVQHHWSVYSDSPVYLIKMGDSVHVYSSGYRRGAMIYLDRQFKSYEIYGLTVEVKFKLGSGWTKCINVFPQFIYPVNIKSGKSILKGENFGYTSPFGFQIYGGYGNGYRKFGYYEKGKYHGTSFYPRDGGTYCARITYEPDKIIASYYDSSCNKLLKSVTVNIPAKYVGKYLSYYWDKQSGTYKKFPSDEFYLAMSVIDDYTRKGFYIYSIKIYGGNSVNNNKIFKWFKFSDIESLGNDVSPLQKHFGILYSDEYVKIEYVGKSKDLTKPELWNIKTYWFSESSGGETKKYLVLSMNKPPSGYTYRIGVTPNSNMIIENVENDESNMIVTIKLNKVKQNSYSILFIDKDGGNDGYIIVYYKGDSNTPEPPYMNTDAFIHPSIRIIDDNFKYTPDYDKNKVYYDFYFKIITYGYIYENGEGKLKAVPRLTNNELGIFHIENYEVSSINPDEKNHLTTYIIHIKGFVNNDKFIHSENYDPLFNIYFDLFINNNKIYTVKTDSDQYFIYDGIIRHIKDDFIKVNVNSVKADYIIEKDNKKYAVIDLDMDLLSMGTDISGFVYLDNNAYSVVLPSTRNHVNLKIIKELSQNQQELNVKLTLEFYPSHFMFEYSTQVSVDLSTAPIRKIQRVAKFTDYEDGEKVRMELNNAVHFNKIKYMLDSIISIQSPNGETVADKLDHLVRKYGSNIVVRDNNGESYIFNEVVGFLEFLKEHSNDEIEFDVLDSDSEVNYDNMAVVTSVNLEKLNEIINTLKTHLIVYDTITHYSSKNVKIDKISTPNWIEYTINEPYIIYKVKNTPDDEQFKVTFNLAVTSLFGGYIEFNQDSGVFIALTSPQNNFIIDAKDYHKVNFSSNVNIKASVEKLERVDVDGKPHYYYLYLKLTGNIESQIDETLYFKLSGVQSNTNIVRVHKGEMVFDTTAIFVIPYSSNTVGEKEVQVILDSGSDQIQIATVKINFDNSISVQAPQVDMTIEELDTNKVRIKYSFNGDYILFSDLIDSMSNTISFECTGECGNYLTLSKLLAHDYGSLTEIKLVKNDNTELITVHGTPLEVLEYIKENYQSGTLYISKLDDKWYRVKINDLTKLNELINTLKTKTVIKPQHFLMIQDSKFKIIDTNGVTINTGNEHRNEDYMNTFMNSIEFTINNLKDIHLDIEIKPEQLFEGYKQVKVISQVSIYSIINGDPIFEIQGLEKEVSVKSIDFILSEKIINKGIYRDEEHGAPSYGEIDSNDQQYNYWTVVELQGQIKIYADIDSETYKNMFIVFKTPLREYNAPVTGNLMSFNVVLKMEKILPEANAGRVEYPLGIKITTKEENSIILYSDNLEVNFENTQVLDPPYRVEVVPESNNIMIIKYKPLSLASENIYSFSDFINKIDSSISYNENSITFRDIFTENPVLSVSFKYTKNGEEFFTNNLHQVLQDIMDNDVKKILAIINQNDKEVNIEINSVDKDLLSNTLNNLNEGLYTIVKTPPIQIKVNLWENDIIPEVIESNNVQYYYIEGDSSGEPYPQGVYDTIINHTKPTNTVKEFGKVSVVGGIGKTIIINVNDITKEGFLKIKVHRKSLELHKITISTSSSLSINGYSNEIFYSFEYNVISMPYLSACGYIPDIPNGDSVIKGEFYNSGLGDKNNGIPLYTVFIDLTEHFGVSYDYISTYEIRNYIDFDYLDKNHISYEFFIVRNKYGHYFIEMTLLNSQALNNSQNNDIKIKLKDKDNTEINVNNLNEISMVKLNYTFEKSEDGTKIHIDIKDNNEQFNLFMYPWLTNDLHVNDLTIKVNGVKLDNNEIKVIDIDDIDKMSDNDFLNTIKDKKAVFFINDNKLLNLILNIDTNTNNIDISVNGDMKLWIIPANTGDDIITYKVAKNILDGWFNKDNVYWNILVYPYISI